MAAIPAEPRKVAWITGGSRGMGADTALRMAEHGYDVAITARDQQRLAAVAKKVEKFGVRAFAHVSDLTDLASVDAFAGAAQEWSGRCDMLCNIGVYQGPGGRQLFQDMAIGELERSLDADVIAPAMLCKRAIPLMVANGGGVIVNMSSAVVFLRPSGTVGDGLGWSLAYAAAKAGIDQFSKLINVELGDAGIRCFTVEPGFVAYGDAFDAVLRDRPGVKVSPAEAIGPAIAWLVRSPDAETLLHERVHLPAITTKYGLLEGWDGPGTPFPNA